MRIVSSGVDLVPRGGIEQVEHRPMAHGLGDRVLIEVDARSRKSSDKTTDVRRVDVHNEVDVVRRPGLALETGGQRARQQVADTGIVKRLDDTLQKALF
jgi:hypothetical protein